jgi:hypothetical protein
VVGWENFFEKEFCFLLDSKRDRREAAGARGQLADGGGAGRSVISGRSGRLRRRGCRRLAAVCFLQEAGCDFCVSNFPLFLSPAFYCNIFLFIFFFEFE